MVSSLGCSICGVLLSGITLWGSVFGTTVLGSITLHFGISLRVLVVGVAVTRSAGMSLALDRWT